MFVFNVKSLLWKSANQKEKLVAAWQCFYQVQIKKFFKDESIMVIFYGMKIISRTYLHVYLIHHCPDMDNQTLWKNTDNYWDYM